MNVNELQQFLRSLSLPLSTSGAKKVADELERMCAGLDRFGTMNVAQFADFLARAHEYVTTGVLPVTTRAKSPVKTSAKTMDLQVVSRAVESIRHLYDHVTNDDVTYTAIDAAIKQLDKQFKKDEILEIARTVGIRSSLKTKRVALDEIERMLKDRKESYQRTRF